MADDEEARDAIERMLDGLYARERTAPRLRVLVAAESLSLPPDVMEVFEFLPSGEYTRPQLVDQLNSAFVARGMGGRLAGII